MVARESKNNAYGKFGGTNKEYYGIFRSGLLTHNTLKKITQDVLVRFSVIVLDHNVKLARHFQDLVRQCPVTD